MSATTRPPVLFVHGGGLGAWIWERWRARFAEHGYATSAVDLRGHGDSPATYRAATVADYVDDVRAAVDTLDAPPVLVGHSMAARVLQRLIDDDASFPAAVFLAPVPLDGLPRHLGAVQMLRHPICAARSFRTGDMEPMFRAPGLDRAAFFSPAVDDATLEEFRARIYGEALGIYLRELPAAVQLRTPLPIPTLVASARFDRLRIETHRRDAERLGADFVVLDDVGHNLMIDAGWRAAADVTAAWLDRACSARLEGNSRTNL